MPNIQLSTGKTIFIPALEYYFGIDDDEMDNFFQSCVADDLGIMIDEPFSDATQQGRLSMDED